jgi:ribosomal protection tetracycline resistance protein
VRTLNLGILAHVDAGKTSLTERLLFAAGIIDEIGSVDDGSTQTDSLALERQRGITIKSAVVSFTVADVTVNLIDTPGHPDFIAEVERVLGVLDGAVLVVSAVEGVQAQTRVLMRTLQRLRIPVIFFVNKIDRAGADSGWVLTEISGRLTPAIVAMGEAHDAGTRGAGVTPCGPADAQHIARLTELLAENDDGLLDAYVEQTIVPYTRLRSALAAQTMRSLVHPVFVGSAVTGAGVAELTAGIAEFLPAPDNAALSGGPARGTVFKVERGPAGEKIAYVRMFSGTVRAREHLAVDGAGLDGTGAAGARRHQGGSKVTAISVFDGGLAIPRPLVTAGQIGKLWGLHDVRIGDIVGDSVGVPGGPCDPAGNPGGAARADGSASVRGLAGYFAPPTLETVVVPSRASDKGALYAALAQLAESDPLINLRQDDVRSELRVSLYGEVQKEVIQATLASEFGIGAGFRESTTICVERPVRSGAAAEFMGEGDNPFRATVGLRIDPAAPGTGVEFGIGIELGALPFSFIKAIRETVTETLREGLSGWEVIDCSVTLTHSGYTPPPPHGWSKWSSSAGDFRRLTPLVLMEALRQAGTTVFEPMHRFSLEIPADTLGSVLPALARLRAIPHTPATSGPLCVLEGDIPAAQVHLLQQQLPGLTRGEGALDCAFDRYEPVRGEVLVRPRTDLNPLNRKEYLLSVTREAIGRP